MPERPWHSLATQEARVRVHPADGNILGCRSLIKRSLAHKVMLWRVYGRLKKYFLLKLWVKMEDRSGNPKGENKFAVLVICSTLFLSLTFITTDWKYIH